MELPNVTVIIADTKNYGRAAYAITKTLEQIKPAKTIWLTDIDYDHPDVEVIKIPAIKDKVDYSRILIKDLYRYFHTSHCLVIQHDGYVINGDSWDETWLLYDYTGAPWLYPDPERNVGNGGFSLRSKRLQKALRYDPKIEIVEPEDEIIGRLYRRFLEKNYLLSFAPEDVADTFSYELRTPICKTFGFHGYFHAPYQETIMITREGAMGDVIALEPVLHYYHKKGYRVVLNTLPQFFSLFQNHYFKVHHPSELDPRIKYREINLDLSYESKPKQLHLKSYFEVCGIPESEMDLRKPKLNFNSTPELKLFKNKYVVIHIDERPQQGRNIRGIEWNRISTRIRALGYLVIQVGKNESAYIPAAIQINTIETGLLAYVISGCNLFIGADSGPSHIAVATGRKSIVFFGNVNPEYIHPDLDNGPYFIYKEVCNKPACWHEVVGTTGMDCYIDKDHPPCSKFDTNDLLKAINELL